MLLGRVNISLTNPSAGSTMAHLVAGASGEAKRQSLKPGNEINPMIVYLNTIGLFRTAPKLHYQFSPTLISIDASFYQVIKYIYIGTTF